MHTHIRHSSRPTTIDAAARALTANGFAVTVVDTIADAKKTALARIPQGAEVLTTTSKTLELSGIADALNASGEYDAILPKCMHLPDNADKKRIQRKLGAAPDYVIGSVHALTLDGKVLVASASGSQLPAYAYGAGTIIWVVGAQKIVKDLAQARHRLETHTFPLEDVRATAAYGHGSSINLVLQYEKDPSGRVKIILVKENIGF